MRQLQQREGKKDRILNRVKISTENHKIEIRGHPQITLSDLLRTIVRI